MRTKTLILFLMLTIIPGILFSQFKRDDKPVEIRKELTNGSFNQSIGWNLFDPSRLSMSHSMSFSYMSIGDKGLSQSVYLNTLRYQLASPLDLTVQWGIQNFPHNSFGSDHPAFQNGFFLSGAELKYKPSDKFEMRLQFNSMPNYYNSMYRSDPFRFPRYRSNFDDSFENE